MEKSFDVLTFRGELPERFEAALAELGPMLNFRSGPDGKPVEVFRAEGPVVEKGPEGIRLGWKKPVHLYRALSLLRENGEADTYAVSEQPCFETGVMFDVSRNAVLRVETIQRLLRSMALMGMDVGMMYTEDTYEVPGEPYFGYQRGRYSMEELRSLDGYADMLGIELVPCIQTLGHLGQVLHWPAMRKYADNSEVLLADAEETYALLRRMIAAAAAPYRSKRIHIGMDEAHGIGLGAHLRRFGYESPHTIIRRHLLRVKELTDELGLRPMMWSDMYFRPDSPTEGYYDGGDPSPEAVASVVPGVDLVYWDYYHNTEEEYAAMLDKHRKLGGTTLFAGGVWTWAGPAPDYDKALRITVPALTACKKAGVPFVLATAWGDNGAEANFLTALPGMQLYAEFAYTGDGSAERLAKRFWTCCGADAAPFLGLSRFNTVPGMRATPTQPVNACKFLLYQDPMVQLFAKDTEGLEMSAHFAALEEEYRRIAGAGGEFAPLMDFYAKLAKVLTGKCRWHERIADAVSREDRAAAASLAASLEDVERDTESLRRSWRALWLETNKPHGFEVIDGRLGAVKARLETARVRVSAWAAGDSGEGLEELREEPLPFMLRAGGALNGCFSFGRCSSACPIDQ